MADDPTPSSHLELATELTIAWLSNPNTRAAAEEVPAFLQTVHEAVANITVTKLAATEQDVSSAPAFTPAVSARRSLASKDHIISMIDGKPYKTLKRHLSVNGLTPAQYRERYGLKHDYPMVAESYAASRRAIAKKLGLGRKPKSASKPAPVPVPAESRKPAKPKRQSARTKAAPVD